MRIYRPDLIASLSSGGALPLDCCGASGIMAAIRRRCAMDIYAYLKNDHRRVAKLMNDLLDIRLPAIRQSLFAQLRAELSVHAAAEERTFYKALSDAARDRGMTGKIRHSEEEHDEICELLDVLTDTPVSSDFWLLKFGELKHAVEHHVQEEESSVFTLAQTLLSRETARRLANDMDALKTVLLLEPAE
jgi:hypothetical protein